MSKAFVIKNKEGKYRDKDGWLTNKLMYADTFESQEEAQTDNYLLENESVVEITIAEGDLKQKIRKQVCDEIREKLPYFEYSFQEPEVPRVKVIEIRDIEFILDQIEQAKVNWYDKRKWKVWRYYKVSTLQQNLHSRRNLFTSKCFQRRPKRVLYLWEL